MSQKSDNPQDILKEGCLHLNISLSSEALSALEIYSSELLRWGKKVNLIAMKSSIREIVENHFLDSLALVPHLQKEESCLIDIGTGAGFPGLVCKVAIPDLSLVLVEPRLKRVSFLQHIIRKLGLAGIEVHSSRIESLDSAKLSSGSCITSRAVADIQDFLHMVKDRVAPACEILCMKGPRWQEELDLAASYMEKNNMVLQRVEEFELPFSRAQRALLFFKMQEF